MIKGRVNPSKRLDEQGISGLGSVLYNATEPELVEQALLRGEGRLGQGGALLVTTGQYTGRSPKDKFVVRTPDVEADIWWENNQPMTPEHFDRLYGDMLAHMRGRDYFVQDLYAGADPELRLDVRVVTELAWHGLFIRHMLRRPERAELDGFVPEYTIINCPSFRADPARHGCRSETVIAIHFARKLILIGNTGYAGENKKSVFTLLNYLLPAKGVMPMHCSANHAQGDAEDSAVFFGLSGTGKTTLSADPERVLIGDDEHGWSERGIFNFEGGCYAKTISLSPEAEPEIYATTTRFATVIENMVYDEETRTLDFEDDSLTANMRCAYPLHYISNASETSLAGIPKNVVMLTCDSFGVLPPIARLSPAQAMYHFLSGFTAKVAGTERGVTEPQPTFSTCFGALHAAPAGSLRPDAAQPDHPSRICLLAGQHRLDGRRFRDRLAHADQRHPGAPVGRAWRHPQQRCFPPGSEFRLRGSCCGRRRAGGAARSAPHLGRPRRLRSAGGAPGADVRRQFCAIRGPYRRRGARRRDRLNRPAQRPASAAAMRSAARSMPRSVRSSSA